MRQEGSERLTKLWTANQTLQRTPESLAVLAGAGGGAGELVVTRNEFQTEVSRGWFESHYVQHVQEMRTVTYPSFLRQHRSA